MASVICVRPSALNRVIYPQKAASVVFAYQSLVQGKTAEDGTATNAFIKATSSTERVLGITNFANAATDADYALNTRKALIIDEMAEWEFAVGTGTADASDPQGYVDLKDEDEVDVTASSVDIVFVTKFISATKVRGNITGWGNLDRPSVN